MTRHSSLIPLNSFDSTLKQIDEESATTEIVLTQQPNLFGEKNIIESISNESNIQNTDSFKDIDKFFDNDFLQFMTDTVDDDSDIRNNISHYQSKRDQSHIALGVTEIHGNIELSQITRGGYSEAKDNNSIKQCSSPDDVESNVTVQQTKHTSKEVAKAIGVERPRDDSLQDLDVAGKDTNDNKSFIEQQKVHGRRERNREHAKRSRKRKKAYIETLQDTILNLRTENEKLRSSMTHHFGFQYVEKLLSSSSVAHPKSISPPLSPLLLPPASSSVLLDNQRQQNQQFTRTPYHISNSSHTKPKRNISLIPSSSNCSITVQKGNKDGQTDINLGQNPIHNHLISNPIEDESESNDQKKNFDRRNIAYKYRLSLLLPKSSPAAT